MVSSKDATRQLKYDDPNIAEFASKQIEASQILFDSMNFEKMQMVSEDGLKLTGYYLPAERKTNRLAILVHGFSVDAKNMANSAVYYHEHGFNVFAGDDRGHGESKGKYRGMGWLDRKDYISWTKLLIDKLGDDTEILLHGMSMGGSTVLAMSGEDLPSNVKCIVDDCGYSSFMDELDYQISLQTPYLPKFPTIPLVSLESKLRVGFYFEDVDMVKQVKKSKTPILFIHGENDTFNPVEMVYKLYDAAASDKELLVVPGANHGESYKVAKEAYEKKLEEFYNKYLN